MKDMLRAGEELIEPEQVRPSSRLRRPNVKVFKGMHGNGYIISGDPTSTSYAAPCSPTDGAILEEILGNPGEQLAWGIPYTPVEKKRRHTMKKERTVGVARKDEREKIAVSRVKNNSDTPRTTLPLERVNNTSPFKVVPPSPRPHEVGHWYRRLSSARLSSPCSARSRTCSVDRRSASKGPSSTQGSFQHDLLVAAPTRNEEFREGSNTPTQWWKSVPEKNRKGSPSPVIQWVDSKDVPDASIPPVEAVKRATVRPKSPNDIYSGGGENSPENDTLTAYSKKIVDKTLSFFEHYRKVSLKATKESETTTPPLQKPSVVRRIRSPPLTTSFSNCVVNRTPRMVVSVPEDSSGSSSPLLYKDENSGNAAEPYKTMFLPRGTVAALNISDRDTHFRQNDGQDRPPTSEGSRIPFRSLVRLPFELEILQNKLEGTRIREKNILTSSMKARRHYRRGRRHKPTPNSIFTKVSNPFFEEYPPVLPGPFKKNVEVEGFATRRPKKR